ncbi:MAG: hypothetical protein ACYTG5_06830 [Planctomycetota bacterium]|jgi:hypothetical protein
MKILVLQSCREPALDWIGVCLGSVREWAKRRGYSYRFMGDEVFDAVPDWYLEKVGDRKQIASDLARLVFLQKALDEEGFEQAIWCDADLLVLDPEMELAFEGSCAFGQEVWMQMHGKGKLRAKRNVHNALCVFRRGCSVLPFLIRCTLSLMERVDPDFLVPQFVGPKLLNALHPFADFSLLPQVGALSPAVVSNLLAEGGEALALMKRESTVPLQAVNLCASLLDESDASRLVMVLEADPQILSSSA